MATARSRFVPIKLSEEDQLQKSIVDHWHARGVPGTLMCAIPNGGARSFTTGARLKVTGTLAGMPDLMCVLPGGRMFFVELKRRGGRLSAVQRERQDQLQACGFHVHVIDHIDDAVALLEARGMLKENGALRRPVPMVG